MANITITKTNGVLSLSDNGHTNEGKSGNVIWHPGRGVGSLRSITIKSDSPNTTEELWGDKPPAPKGVNFKGTISANAEVGWAWDYDIVTDVGSIDPRIQVN